MKPRHLSYYTFCAGAKVIAVISHCFTQFDSLHHYYLKILSFYDCIFGFLCRSAQRTQKRPNTEEESESASALHTQGHGKGRVKLHAHFLTQAFTLFLVILFEVKATVAVHTGIVVGHSVKGRSR